MLGTRRMYQIIWTYLPKAGHQIECLAEDCLLLLKLTIPLALLAVQNVYQILGAWIIKILRKLGHHNLENWRNFFFILNKNPRVPGLWIAYCCSNVIFLSVKWVFPWFLGLNFCSFSFFLVGSTSFSERQRKWKEELAQELDRKRGIVFVLISTNFLNLRSLSLCVHLFFSHCLLRNLKVHLPSIL